MTIKKLLVLLSVCAASAWMSPAHASSENIRMDSAPNTLNDPATLQSGARTFMNYCSGCHSAAYVRYNRLKDIGITEDQIKANLLFASEKVGDTMKSAMDPKNAKDWFGAVPPDLSLIARSRAGSGFSGADYLYTLLRSYYRDETKATGWNNLAFPNIGMPHPLWELQGTRSANFEKEKVHGVEQEVFKGYSQIKPGKMSAAEYDKTVADLVNFLQWMGEPGQSQRTRIGVWVLLFIGVFTLIAWRLNASYWKDVK